MSTEGGASVSRRLGEGMDGSDLAQPGVGPWDNSVPASGINPGKNGEVREVREDRCKRRDER